jgi:hypothetical protein
MSLPPAYLAEKLTQPLPIKTGGVLRTIRCAADYMLALPDQRAELCNRWRRTAELILGQATMRSSTSGPCADALTSARPDFAPRPLQHVRTLHPSLHLGRHPQAVPAHIAGIERAAELQRLPYRHRQAILTCRPKGPPDSPYPGRIYGRVYGEQG